MADTPAITPTIEVVSDDGRTRIERVMYKGVEIGRNVGITPDPAEQAATAALDARRAVLLKQLDPNQPDPTDKEFKDAQAFIAVAADLGADVAVAAAAGELVVDVAVDAPVGPVKGGG